MYKVYNRNPEGDRLPDCVTRAISLGTGADYRDVQKMLHINGDEKDCDALCLDCYSQLLDDIGYPKLDGNKKTVSDLCSEHKNDTLLVRIEGHLTCCINGNCYDIWDCTNKPVDVYWLIID